MRVTDAFMQGGARGRRLGSSTRRTDGKVAKTVKARDLWEQIAHAAWACADPGVQFHDTINEWHTCPADGPIHASQPVLGVHVPRRHRLQPRVAEPADVPRRTAAFDVEAYVHATRLWTVMLEISVLMAQFPSARIAELSYDFRTLGLGYANLGGLLMTMGIPYDSRRGPRALRRADRDHDRRGLRDLGRDGGRARRRSPATPRTASTCCA